MRQGARCRQSVTRLAKVPVESDTERLPTASACFNTLKLPTFGSEKAMREKLLMVIQSGAGFELS